MEDIGCHFKFEKIYGNSYHETKLLMSSGRNCLRYILRERKIKKIMLPYLLCESLEEVARKEGIEVIPYHIDKRLMPQISDLGILNEETYLYFVNYYGLLKNEINEIIKKFKYVIIDNTHDFFNKTPYNADVIYNFRKYFGVPDGACIVSPDLEYNKKYKRGMSLDKIREMVLRDETGEYFHYQTFHDADKYFANEDLCYMSNFTENYLQAIDYNKVMQQRLKNYMLLAQELNQVNKLNLRNQKLTYMYPFLYEDGIQLRKYLLDNKIYSLLLWPTVEWNGANKFEKERAYQTLMLPIDQRYTEDEMYYISDMIKKYDRKRVIKKQGS